MSEMAQPLSNAAKGGKLKRFIPLGALVIAIVLFFATGLHRQLSFDGIAVHYGQLSGFVADRPIVSGLAMIAVYAAATAVSFPAAWLLTVTAGLVFGWVLASAYVAIGATLGACLLYFAASTAFAGFFREKAGGAIKKMAEGFREDAVSYMLFLRLAPVFPFVLVNVVPAILGVPFIIYLWTTFVGIIPGVVAYTFAGEGLRSIVGARAEACAADVAPCGEGLSPGDLVTPQILIAFALLAIISLLPVVLKRMRRSGKGE